MDLIEELETVFGRVDYQKSGNDTEDCEVRRKKPRPNRGAEFDAKDYARMRLSKQWRSNWRERFDHYRRIDLTEAQATPFDDRIYDSDAILEDIGPDDEGFHGTAQTFAVESARKIVERAQLELGEELVDDATKIELDDKAGEKWDQFYRIHQDSFFQERNWLQREFSVLDPVRAGSGPSHILEVGCGTGSTLLSIARWFPKAKLSGVDYALSAVETLRSLAAFDSSRMRVAQADASKPGELEAFMKGGCSSMADIVTLFFVLSAMTPVGAVAAVQAIASVMQPGGHVCFRDYGLYDMTQLRFICKSGRKLADRFYLREDGTRTYFFDEAVTRELFEKNGFTTIECRTVCILLRNRKKNDHMYRVFTQGLFRRSQ